jgi:predicted MPP superfamily phosphohydrolase
MRGLIHFPLILLVLLSLMFVAQRFWFVRAWRLIDTAARPEWRYLLQGLWIAAIVLLLTAVFAPIFSHWSPRRDLAIWLISISRLWLVASVLAFLAVTAVALIEWLSRSVMFAIPSGARFDPARRAFLGYAAYLAGGIPFLATAWGFSGERLRYHVERVEVPIADLPRSLDGLRIVQLSDIHIGAFMPQTEVRRAVKMANQLSPDLAVLTGDLISFDSDPLEACIAELSKLRAPLGIWGCNGNHELYAEAEAASQALFERYGMRLLRQQNTELQWRSGKLNLIGVDYQRGSAPSNEQTSMLQSIESLVRKDIPNILLSHNPNTFPRAAALGIELSLAGHTHGGQIRVEIVNRRWNPARFFTKFVAGLYHLPLGEGAALTAEPAVQLSPKTALLYVNRGLGTFAMPVRLGVPPEITLLTLRAPG